MKKILVPTDFSESARIAEDVGLEIAKKAKAEIHFLHIVFTPVEWTKLTLEQEKQFPDIKAKIGYAKDELNKLVKRAEKLKLKVKHFLYFDKGREEIEQHIMEHDHDFIVMGSHGVRGIKKIIGSNAQRVVRNSPAPVLTVKKTQKNFEIKNIVFASNFEEDVYLPFLKIIDFANIMKAQIHLLYVNMPFNFKETDVARESMMNFLKKCPRGNCSINIYDSLNEERGINKFSDEIKADLIALTTHGRTGFMRLISLNITESLVANSKLPILSVNINSR